MQNRNAFCAKFLLGYKMHPVSRGHRCPPPKSATTGNGGSAPSIFHCRQIVGNLFLVGNLSFKMQNLMLKNEKPHFKKESGEGHIVATTTAICCVGNLQCLSEKN